MNVIPLPELVVAFAVGVILIAARALWKEFDLTAPHDPDDPRELVGQGDGGPYCDRGAPARRAPTVVSA
jgi:hypothetical protein